jgi:spore coat protein CotH
MNAKGKKAVRIMSSLRSTAGILVALLASCGILTKASDAPPPSPTDAVFDDSIVQSISLTINSQDWESLRANVFDNTYYPVDFKWRDQTLRGVGIRSRGTGSRYGPKPGLRVDFNRYNSDQVFLGTLKSIVLRNQTQDASNMRERISMLLFRRLGVVAPREAFTQLFVNNEYVGLYSIVENIDKPFLKRYYGENDGYLFKYDYNVGDAPWYFEDRGPDPDLYVPSPFEPETHESDPHPEPIAEIVRIVNNDSDASFRMRIDPYISWDNFAKHIAIENCVTDTDGFNGDYGVNNFYWYHWENSNLFTWIPWDKSEAFQGGADFGIFHNFLDGAPALRNRLSARAMTQDDVRNTYLDTLLACARSLAERDPQARDDERGWMEREIDREYQQIHDLVYADPQKPFTNDDFEHEVDVLRGFARDRAKGIETQVAAFRR